jgi:hypothetical protein
MLGQQSCAAADIENMFTFLDAKPFNSVATKFGLAIDADVAVALR